MYRHTLRLIREPMPEPYGRQVFRPADVAELLAELIGDEPAEVTVALLLDRRHRVRGVAEIGRGSTHTAPLEAADVLRHALIAGAPAVLLGHNHPSGEPTPSPDDVAVTRRLARAAELVGVELVDHVIIGEPGRHTSLVSSGALT